MRNLIKALLFAVVVAAPFPVLAAQRRIPDITIDKMESIADRVRALRATPSTITMRAGQSIPLDSIRVYALDANGHDIGRLVVFNFAIKPGEPAMAMPGRISATK